ncbi:MAG: hypothetical protein ACREHC_01440 [Candidatus Levyibacteriota bacterium]
MVTFRKKDKEAWVKAFTALSGNLAAGYFGLVLIAPNFSPLRSVTDVLILTYDLVLGIVFLWITYKLERSLL